MSELDTQSTFAVKVEVISWVTRLVGGHETGRVYLEEMAEPGDTLGTVLHRLSNRFPELAPILWDRVSGELGEHIEVVVNDAFLGVERDLDSPVREGDRVSLLGALTGG